MPDVNGMNIIDLSEQAAPNAVQRPPSLRQRLANAWNSLQGRPFGPGQPQAPVIPSTEPDATPRQFQYPAGANLIASPRREQPALLTPFEQLRNLAALYDIAAMCIAARIEEMQGMSWSVAAKNKKEQTALQDTCDEVKSFFEQPDRLNHYHAWMGMLLYELFSTDAMTIYKRPDLGGRLYSLDVVDGSTIKPLLDVRGRTVAYQQVIQGYTETGYRRPSADEAEEQFPQYSLQELLYLPRWTRSFTPYGFPPTEWIIMRVNTALRKQTFDLSWFTDGNIPEMIATAPEGNINPDQMRQFEDWFNSVLAGNDAARRRVHFIPWNMNFQVLKEMQYSTVLDEWMLRVTCAAYSVPPQELGFTYDVNRATAEMQEAVNERRGLKPLANWLKATLFDPIIRKDLAALYGDNNAERSFPGAPTHPERSPFDAIEWQWHFGDRTDELVQAQSDQVYLSLGVVSPNEVRSMRFGDVLEGPAPGMPAQPSMFGEPPAPAQAPDQPAPATESGPMAYLASQQKLIEEMRRWKEKALRTVKLGKSANVPFESELIPKELHDWIAGELLKAKDGTAVRDIFQAAPEVAAQRFFRGEEGWERYG